MRKTKDVWYWLTDNVEEKNEVKKQENVLWNDRKQLINVTHTFLNALFFILKGKKKRSWGGWIV